MARMNEVPLAVSSDRQARRTAGSRPMVFEDSPGFEFAVESIHRIGRLVDDLCPTVKISVSTAPRLTLRPSLTLHFNGRPLTL